MRVLVVDDHLPTVELMGMTLTSFGHSVLTATSVAGALELVSRDRPDVILSDLNFSATRGEALDGYALARAVRANPDTTNLGMLAISGVTSPSELQAALDSGFNGVVVKPFDVGSLLERITAVAYPRSGAIIS